eukprot:3178099-Prymnesium_polylepis.1
MEAVFWEQAVAALDRPRLPLQSRWREAAKWAAESWVVRVVLTVARKAPRPRPPRQSRCREAVRWAAAPRAERAARAAR